MAPDQTATGRPSAQAPRTRRTPSQPLDVINVPGALLKLSTLAQISGQSLSTLYRAAAARELVLIKRGARCTRVTSEAARAYLASLGQGGK